ncbi:hypothetical protein JHV675_52710 [Mycobacterium avium subsp. hominissuis]
MPDAVRYPSATPADLDETVRAVRAVAMIRRPTALTARTVSSRSAGVADG